MNNLTKAQIIEKYKEVETRNILLTDKLSNFNDREEQVRKNISLFLESFESTDGWSSRKVIRTLEWPEIYFELGKLKESEKDLRLDIEDRERIKHLENDIRNITKVMEEKLLNKNI
jgi:hypothetical protein